MRSLNCGPEHDRLYPMKKFQVKTYQILSKKVEKGRRIRLAFLSDLHGASYGRGNSRLARAVERLGPDLILVGGDMMVGEPNPRLEAAEELLRALVKKRPVYYAFGNHESRLMENPKKYGKSFPAFCRRLKARGVCFLRNQKATVDVGAGVPVTLWGWDGPRRFYRKLRSVSMEDGYLERTLGRPEPKAYHILLAHNPQFAQAYFSWGADLILAGHYHGGVCRFSENRGLLAPNFRLFPPYCCGLFSQGEQRMAVSPGLGEHTVRLRVHNPRELFAIEIAHGGDA